MKWLHTAEKDLKCGRCKKPIKKGNLYFPTIRNECLSCAYLTAYNKHGYYENMVGMMRHWGEIKDEIKEAKK